MVNSAKTDDTVPQKEATKPQDPPKEKPAKEPRKGSPRSTPSRAVLRAFLPVAKAIAAGNRPNLDWAAVVAALESGDKGAAKDLFTAAV